MTRIPHELAWGDVYLSPLLPAFGAALIGAWLTGILLNRTGVARYVAFPSLTFLALMAFYLLLIDALWIKL